jgi:hypothetical protein
MVDRAGTVAALRLSVAARAAPLISIGVVDPGKMTGAAGAAVTAGALSDQLGATEASFPAFGAAAIRAIAPKHAADATPIVIFIEKKLTCDPGFWGTTHGSQRYSCRRGLRFAVSSRASRFGFRLGRALRFVLQV